MFSNLTDFKYRRTGTQALGFYIAYFILFLVVGGLLGGAMSINGMSVATIARYANFLAVVLTLILSFTILNKKNLLNNFGFILLGLLSGILAVFGGGLLGLIPVAYLSTK